MSSSPILIVGASAAGVSAARTLRDEGFDGAVVLIDADENPPYQRPPLSKQLLENPEIELSDFPLLTLEEADDLKIDLRLGQRVTSLDPETPAVTLADGTRLNGRSVILATGGQARRLSVPGADLAGVHVIRSYGDVVALRRDLTDAEAVVVIGGGLIGTEAAISVAASGKRVIWLDGADRPLAHIFPDAIADHLVAAHRADGLDLRVGVRLSHLVERSGRVIGVVLADGETIAADVVILGVGMTPCVALARDAGLACSNGIDVDSVQRTQASNVYAAGDVAALPGAEANARIRHEHWRAAEHQGAVAARAILGLDPLDAAPAWFWSDQGRFHIEMVGRRSGDSLTRPGGKGPIVFEMQGDVVVGAASIDEPNAVRVALRLIRSGHPVNRARLIDPTQSLREMMLP